MPENCCEKYGDCCRAFMGALAIAGLVLSILALESCEFIKYTDKLDVNGQEGKLGLFRADLLADIPDAQNCDKYPDSFNLPGAHTFSQVVAIIASCGGIAGLVFMAVEGCCFKYCCSRMLISLSFTLAWVCTALTFAVYGSETSSFGGNYCGAARNCEIGQGSAYDIAAFCLFFIPSIVVCCTPKPEPLFCKARRKSQEAKEKKEDEDNKMEVDKGDDKDEEKGEKDASDMQPAVTE